MEARTEAALSDRGLVPRPTVAARVGRALRAGSLVVTAEAGAGKTVALEQGLAEAQLAAAWMRCVPAHRDAGRLLVDLLDAVHAAAPGAAGVLRARVTSGAAAVDPEELLGALTSELERLLVEPLVIVLDDAEVLRGAAAALAAVDRLLRGHGRVRTAVASRRSLGLGDARLRASGRLTELRGADLAFDAVDTAALLREHAGREPPLEEVEEVLRRTHGWPLGIALGVRAASDDGKRPVAEYVEEEVLRALPRDLRDALIDASLMDELTASLAAAAGLPDGFLGSPEAHAVFLRPAGGGHRFHPLVREVLLDRFAAERAPAQAAAVHGRVAAALEAARRNEEAIDHWLAAGEPGRAARLLAAEGQRLLATPRSVAARLDRLPDPVRASPPMALLDGRVAYGAGRHEDAIELSRRAVAGFAAAGETRHEWAARLALVDALHAHGRLAETLEVVEGFDEGAAREAPSAPSVAVIASMCASHVGRLDLCAELRERMLAHPCAAGARAIDPALQGFFLDRPRGRLDDALRRGREAVAALEREDPFGRLPYVRALLHNLLEDFGYDEEALATSLQAEQDGVQIGVAGYVGPLLRQHRAGILARLGRLPEAEAELAWVGDRRGGGWRRTDLSVALVAAARGDHAAAVDAAQRTLATVEGGPLVRWSHAVCFAVPVLARCGQPGVAAAALDRLLAAWIEGFDASRPLALRAWLRAAEGDAGAWDDLRAAWTAAGDQVRHLVRREWPRLEGLLTDALEEGALDVGEVVSAVEGAWPGGEHLLALTDHPAPGVRRAALRAAVASGRPEVPARLAALEDDPHPDVANAARRAARALRETPPSRLYTTLGGFGVRIGAWRVPASAWARAATARLVRLLLVHPEGATEQVLFEAFWAGRDATAARRSLQVEISRARAVLDGQAGADDSAIARTPSGYRLVLREGDLIDAEEFERAARAALGRPAPDARSALEAAVRLWTGIPLPDEEGEWAQPWRRRLVALQAEVLGALAAAHRRQGEHAAAAQVAAQHVALDPLDEGAHEELIRAYARTGRRAHALRQFLVCRRALVDELGVEPSARLRELQLRVLAGEPV